MQTLTLKVGDPMVKQSTQNKEDEKFKRESSNLTNSAREAKSLIRTMARSICHLILKFKLKEIGIGVKCEGKLILSGTKNIKIGDKSYFYKNVTLKTEGRGYIHIGENVKIGRNVSIISRNNVTIEDNAIIGEGVSITDILALDSEISALNGTKSVYIGKDVWIGKKTKVNAGTTIGNGATISSNSVISRSIPPHVIAGGAPARVLKDR
jgi:acetyltransferase-like isoleucine patch superfamily enzyme